MSEPDGARGILTEADREYLRNPDEYSRQASYNRERKIRERLQRAMLDFPLLAAGLEDDILADLFAADRTVEETEDGVTETVSEVPTEAATLPSAAAYLVRASLAGDSITPAVGSGAEATLQPFSRAVERGIEQWLGDHHGVTGNVTVSVSVEDLQRVDEVVADLQGEAPVTGRDRLEAAVELSRAGYSADEIADIVGATEDNSAEE